MSTLARRYRLLYSCFYLYLAFIGFLDALNELVPWRLQLLPPLTLPATFYVYIYGNFFHMDEEKKFLGISGKGLK